VFTVGVHDVLCSRDLLSDTKFAAVVIHWKWSLSNGHSASFPLGERIFPAPRSMLQITWQYSRRDTLCYVN